MDKDSVCKAGDLGLIPRSGRSPGEGNGNSLQYSYLKNSINRGAVWAIVKRVTKSQTQLTVHAHSITHVHTHIVKSYLMTILENIHEII